MKNISILGSTGSIGNQALDIIRSDRNRYNVIALSANSNVEVLINQSLEFMPKYVVVMEERAYLYLCQKLANYDIKVLKGIEGLEFISSLDEVDIVLTSVVGMIGLRPTIAAIRAGKTIALANKETLVAGGEIVARELNKSNARILPVDSEHCALFQCLLGEDARSINNLILTASGGPFRGKKKSELQNVTPEMALKHPKWNMGKKISIDSATLMNKALEVIEAHWLYNVDYEKIRVVVHPQSIIHSMVEYIDGSIIAQMANTDMRHPIQYAFEYPERRNSVIGFLDLIKNNTLNFEEPDYDTFECLKLGYEAGKRGGTATTVLNAANEEAVKLFLERKIGFLDIPMLIRDSLEHFKAEREVTLEKILELEALTREYVNSII